MNFLSSAVVLRRTDLSAQLFLSFYLAGCATNGPDAIEQNRYGFNPTQRKDLGTLINETEQWQLGVVSLEGYSTYPEKALECGSCIKSYMSDAGIERNRIYVSGASNAVAVKNGLSPTAPSKVLMLVQIFERIELGDPRPRRSKNLEFLDFC